MTSQLVHITSILVTGPSFMSILSLVLELWQFSFIRDWPEIRKSEIPPSEFCLISKDWGESEIPNLVQNEMLLNASKCQGFSFYCFWVIKGKSAGRVKSTTPSPPPRLGLISDNSLSPEIVSDISNLGSVSSNWNSSNVKSYDKNSSSPRLVLENLKLNNNHRLVIGNLNINSISNKFDNLRLIIQGKTDILVITETKTNSAFPLNQFEIQGY